VLLPDGSILFAQPDYLDPYHVRNDLYIERDGVETRLTRGARLSSPDARGDGEIVAVQDAPATTLLVRVSRDGRTIAPITRISIDEQWSDPRWSPEGTRIAAVMQSRGLSRIAILDADGRLIDSFGATRAINSRPSWSPDGRRIYFSSERSGSPQIYVADVTSFPPAVSRITDAATGVFSPEVSPDQSRLATLLFKADGYHVGVAPLADQQSGISSADSTRTSPREGCGACLNLVTGLAPVGQADTSRSRPYSPWRSLLPRYWLPVFESATGVGTSWGAVTSGFDIIGRHSYTLEALRNNGLRQNSAWLWYTYAGLGLPLIDVYASQNFSNDLLYIDNAGTFTRVGTLSERSRVASVRATLIRPRFRTYSFGSLGVEAENIRYLTSPDTLLPYLPPFYETAYTYPALIASAGWSNARRPALSISPEDGISASVSGKQRWQRGASGSSTRSVVAVTSAYRSLDLPGFAHHVIALRAAGGLTDARSPTLYSAGGISGNTLEVFPGVDIGQQRRTFGVRGYPVSAEAGIRAYSAAIEYRAPLAAPSRGFRFLPVFIDRTSLTLFGEAGRAFCPASAVTPGGVCRAGDVGNPLMRSVGAELNVDTGLQLDLQARMRAGVAFPLANREQLRARRASAYFTFGASF
jgi:hypothetical protein